LFTFVVSALIALNAIMSRDRGHIHVVRGHNQHGHLETIVRSATQAMRWSLHEYEISVNVAAICFLTRLMFFTFWPLSIDPLNTVNLNWSPVRYFTILVIASANHILQGRHEYVRPVVHVTREQ